MSLGYSAVPTPVPTAAPTDISQHPKFLEKSDLEVNIEVEWATNITVLAFALFAGSLLSFLSFVFVWL